MTYTWTEYNRDIEYMIVRASDGDFARGQRQRPRTKVVHGTFARGQRQSPVRGTVRGRKGIGR